MKNWLVTYKDRASNLFGCITYFANTIYDVKIQFRNEYIDKHLSIEKIEILGRNRI